MVAGNSTAQGKQSNEKQIREDVDMSLFEHIGELRKRFIYILIVLVAGLILGLIAVQPSYNYLMSLEPANGIALHAFSLWDGIGIYMKFAVAIALIPAIPFAVYQLWAFVKPALKKNEQRATLKYIPFALIMFLIGLAFAYFVVFPLAFTFTRHMTAKLHLEETFGMAQYFTFMFNIIIPIALLFELPLIIMFLTAIRILNPNRLRKMRRIAYFVLILIGTLVTPPDFISDMLVAVPLIVLYEISIYMAGIVYRKQLGAPRWESEYSALAEIP
ncbi:Sec-independent protein translocase protein TatCy [Paenibacillus allorhizoplanae]|uniref:Sec-independent protein translocase protein TatC n=2 Tax=Paenibacillus allorhizoplanae TaxID=2905648 RepID=A0ABM9CFP4_9BACL|nr:Sec-independent protein translocase protein TatCy [Paenibacillus allorhizoplanae]